MKKIFLLTLICMLSLSFVACEKKGETEVISANDIEQDELFQNVLLQTSMMRSEPMTIEERVDYMLAIYRTTFEASPSLLKHPYQIEHYCTGATSIAFDDAPELLSVKTSSELHKILVEPLIMAYEYWNAQITEEPEVDFDALIPELREKALEILK